MAMRLLLLGRHMDHRLAMIGGRKFMFADNVYQNMMDFFYVGPVPKHCAAVRLKLRNLNLDPHLKVKIGTPVTPALEIFTQTFVFLRLLIFDL